ncbi:aminotransferase class I/II-fold pyridoxal phosphate-dependent enzyme [Salinibacterium sp. dk2585]|uniref:DegT/DnrJ/EryC1/StrS family aminotransferase n=1 Tax=unclassified Salinibacterium TaxID=2632331 RepID=UPI0011C25097|nr:MULTISPECIES: aminotransferase class I/II-fold pyridoxal phosphate-dependent enzyme [unclassified Salinibacterium]QEE60846.1 aminotransferase class I/II-fold pyridoxal phosphate-dependent enzyme [Salinibacterium sp. dk2585]TXK55918.1 aminotransferase class I/II-fold pyridoxal phosphate-dependent enzyme [Salinibacterium sp. dk5596]
MSERIYMSSPDVGKAEEDAIVGAIHSGWIAPLGPDVDAFEREIADRTGRRHAVALSSGTAALHLALLGMEVQPGDVVLTSSMTFAATANAIRYVGAEPVFIDSDIRSGNMDVDLLEEALSDFARRGERVVAILPVDLLGKVADYSRIMLLADEYGVPVLSDAAESLGASHNGSPAGSFGVAAAVSFNGNKIMTTSGGGMLLTDDEPLALRARYLATQARQPVLHYEHTEIGYNYRLSNLLAALGRAQLARLDEMIARRRQLRERYRAFFAGIEGVSIFGGETDAEDNFWLTSILVDSESTGWLPSELSAWLGADDIESRPLWKPMHMQPVFSACRSYVTGASAELFGSGLTLPSGSALTESQIQRVFARISTFLEK